jgi:hypothetical protein
MPDINRRDAQRQTVPIEDEFDSPPSYEASTGASASAQAPAAFTTPTATSTAPPTIPTPPSPTASSHSSLDGHDRAGLLSTPGFKAQGYLPQFAQAPLRRRESGPSCSSCGGHGDGRNHGHNDDAGYRANRPMTTAGPEAYDDAKWEPLLDTPGCCCSESGGCCGSKRGGCCFSDRGGCCFSDREACCFSDNGACCFSDTRGCCFSTGGGCCCTAGPPPRNR